MSLDLEISPKQKRSPGAPCCEPAAFPEVTPTEASRIADVAKALADPIRVQVLDVLRRHAGQVCVCELEPLFDVSQPTLSHHLKKLREADVVGVERRGLWSFYYVQPEALELLHAWLD